MPAKLRSLPNSLLFLALSAALLAVEAWIVGRADFPTQPGVVSLAVTLDIVLGLPLLFYLLVARRKRLPLITARAASHGASGSSRPARQDQGRQRNRSQHR